MKICLENAQEIINAFMPLILKTVDSFNFLERDEAIDYARMVVIDAIEKYDEKKSNFPGFLKYKMRYFFLDLSKKKKTDSLNDRDKDGIEKIEKLDSNIDIEDDFFEKERLKCLKAGLVLLKEKDQLILKYKYQDGKSHKEIASILSINAKTVTNRHYLAIRELRKHFEKNQMDL